MFQSLKQKIGEDLKSVAFYSKSFLDPKETDSDSFFREISYQIDLEQFIKVIDSCYDNDLQKSVPILLQIMCPQLIEQYKAKYIIQLWSKDGRKMHEKLIQNVPRFWSNNENYFTYYLHEDENPDKSVVFVKGETGGIVTFSDYDLDDNIIKIQLRATNFFTSYSATHLYVHWITQLVNDGSFSTLRLRKIPFNQKILSFNHQGNFYVESPDNQAEQNNFQFQAINDDAKFTYSFDQTSEVVPRKLLIQPDPIVKFLEQRLSYTYGIAMRKSGGFDLYWEGQLRYSSKEDERVVDIGKTLNSFYFKMVDGRILKFQHNSISNLHFDLHVDATDETDWDSIFYQNAIPYCIKYSKQTFIGQVYRSFALTEYDGIPVLALGFNSTLIIYDFRNNVYLNHINFNSEIYQVFSYKKENAEALGVVVKTGDIYIDELRNYPLDSPTHSTKGTFSQFVLGQPKDNCFIINYSGNAYLDVNCSMTKISSNSIESTSKIVKMVYPTVDKKPSFLIQNGTNIKIYEVNGTALSLVTEVANCGTQAALHTAIDYGNGKYTVLIDRLDITVLNMRDQTSKQYKNQKVLSVLSLSAFSNNAICGEDTPLLLNSGIRNYDFKELCEDGVCKGLQLRRFVVGYAPTMLDSLFVKRCSFLQATNKIWVCPSLTSNQFTFIGLETPLIYKVHFDKLIVLTTTGYLQTFDITNGKFLKQVKVPGGEWCSNFMVLNSAPFKDTSLLEGKCLLICKTNLPVDSHQRSEFFEPWQSETRFERQKPKQITKDINYRDYKVVEILNEDSIKEYISFVFTNYSYHKLYINQQNDRMFERQGGNQGYFYQAIKQDSGTQVKWQLINRVARLNVELFANNQSLEFMITHNTDFSMYLERNIRSNQFVVKDSYTNKVLYEIPPEMMPFDKNPETARMLMHKIRWIDNNRFKIINNEGYESIIDVTKNCEEQAWNKLPLITKEQLDISPRYFLPPQGNLFYEKMILKWQNYKTTYYLDGKTDKTSLYNTMFKLNPYDISATNLSFSYIDMKLVELICTGEKQVTDLNEDMIQYLVNVIFPGGNTIMHLLCEKRQADDVIKIFQLTQPNKSDCREIKYYVPFLPNFKGETPLHILVKQRDFKNVGIMLEYLKGYPIDHHFRQIKDLFPLLIEKQIPALLDYLDYRTFQTAQTSLMTMIAMKEGSSGITASPLHIDQNEFDAKFKSEDKEDVESPALVEFIDMPEIYHYNDSSFEPFFAALAGTDWYDLFTKKPIQKVIEFNYELVKRYTIRRLFIPYFMFLGLFVCEFNLIQVLLSNALKDPEQAASTQTLEAISLTIQSILIIFASYFLLNEIKQLASQGPTYLLSIWNYIDVIPPLGLILMFVFQFIPIVSYETEKTIQALVTFFMWIKLLYFMRIFKETGYYIRMITYVIYDMRFFLLILFIAMLAFGDAFLSLSLANQNDEDKFVFNFIDSSVYTYRLILGDFQTDQFGGVSSLLVWILFLLCTVFNMIIMLNLLISIISESFANMNQNAANATYQEMASLISENSYLVPADLRSNYAAENKFLLIVTDLENDKQESYDAYMDQFESIKKSLITLVQANEKGSSDQKAVLEQIKLLNAMGVENKTTLENCAKETKELRTLYNTLASKEEE